MCSLIAGLTGLWMSLTYPPAEHDGPLLTGFRVVFGAAMVTSLALGLVAIRRRDVARHQVWVTRGYAIGLGAGTQALVHLPWLFLAAAPQQLGRALLMAAGWVINLAVAEWSLRRVRGTATVVRQPEAAA